MFSSCVPGNKFSYIRYEAIIFLEEKPPRHHCYVRKSSPIQLSYADTNKWINEKAGRMVIIKFVIFNVWFKKWTALKISTVTIFQVCVGGMQKKRKKKSSTFLRQWKTHFYRSRCIYNAIKNLHKKYVTPAIENYYAFCNKLYWQQSISTWTITVVKTRVIIGETSEMEKYFDPFPHIFKFGNARMNDFFCCFG